MNEAFLIRARGVTEGCPRDFLYAANAATVEEAIALVARLVAPGTELGATGDTLSPMSALAIRLLPGHAKLV